MVVAKVFIVIVMFPVMLLINMVDFMIGYAKGIKEIIDGTF